MAYEECSFLDVPCHMGNLGTWFQRGVDWFHNAMADMVYNVLVAIPVPSWMGNTSMALPDGVLWFLSAFQFDWGISVVMSAYISRFALRRIPFFG